MLKIISLLIQMLFHSAFLKCPTTHKIKIKEFLRTQIKPGFIFLIQVCFFLVYLGNLNDLEYVLGKF